MLFFHLWNHIKITFFRIDPKYDLAKYKATTDEVILESAQLTDEKKLKSEFFEDKSRSILSSVFHLANVSNFSIKILGAIYIWMYYSNILAIFSVQWIGYWWIQSSRTNEFDGHVWYNDHRMERKAEMGCCSTFHCYQISLRQNSKAMFTYSVDRTLLENQWWNWILTSMQSDFTWDQFWRILKL